MFNLYIYLLVMFNNFSHKKDKLFYFMVIFFAKI